MIMLRAALTEISKYRTLKKGMSSFKQFPHIKDSDFPATPGKLLNQWFDDAKEAEIPLPTAGSLATAALPSGRVSNRFVNFRYANEDSTLTFYSDFEKSRKAKDLKSNQRVAVTFYWQQINRSVRIEGKFVFLSKEDAQAAFETKPKQFKAMLSMGPQSQPVPDGRAFLQSKLENLVNKPDEDLSVPEWWYGARLAPDWIEFWQGNPDRISDRIEYTLEDDQWKVQRIGP